MKILLLLLVSGMNAFSQTAEEKAAIAPYLPKGCQMAQQAFLAQGGEIRKNTAGRRVYAAGAVQGLTIEQAVAKFNTTWASSPASVKMTWAKRAMATGSPDLAEASPADQARDAESAAAAERAKQAASMQKTLADLETDTRLRKLEADESERKRKDRLGK